MKPSDVLIIAAIVLIIGGAVAYIIKAKKSGRKCIGCPDSASCSSAKGGKCQGSCSSCSCCQVDRDSEK